MATSLEELRQQAKDLFNKADYHGINKLLTKEILDQYDDPELYSRKGRAAYELAHYDDALHFTQKAITRNPNYHQAYLTRGNTWFIKKDYDKAIAEYDKAVELNPENHLNYYNRANAWLAKGQFDKAITDYNEALRIDPKDPDTYYNRGNTWFDMGEYDKAIEDYTQVIQLSPRDSEAFFNRGGSWFNKGLYDKAIEDYNTALELKPDLNNGLYNLGLALKATGDLKAALNTFRKSKELNHRTDDSESQISEIKDRLAVSINAEISNDIEKIKNIVRAIRQKSLAEKEITHVVHYSKLLVADLITNDVDSHLHYSNVIYMNDPQEGKTFIDFLNDLEIKDWFERSSYKNESTIFLGSFLPAVTGDEEDGDAEDQLLLWRTYGKDEKGIDAGGCNFVIDSSFFISEKARLSSPLPPTFQDIKDAIEKGRQFTDDDRNRLLKVQYIRKNKLVNDHDGIISQLIDYLKEEIKKLVKKNKEESIDARLYTDSKIFEALQELCHLFKAADYSFEKEVRIIRTESRNSENIQYYKKPDGEDPVPPKHFYVKSEKRILPYLKKIYLGPKVKDPSHWSLHFDYSLRKSARKDEKEGTEFADLEKKIYDKMPFTPEESIRYEQLKKTYGGVDIAKEKIRPNEIEIIPSKCRFV